MARIGNEIESTAMRDNSTGMNLKGPIVYASDNGRVHIGRDEAVVAPCCLCCRNGHTRFLVELGHLC